MTRSRWILVAPVVLLVAACGSSSTSSKSAPAPAATTAAAISSPASANTVKLTAKTVPGLGTVLVDGNGRTLYSFAPDHAKKVTCVSGCASVWPPLSTPAGSKPSTSGHVNAALISSDVNPSGGRVVTYAGWPLYRYVGDHGADTAHGQGLNASGGYWWAISPAGQVVTRAARSSSGSGAAGSGSGTAGSGSTSRSGGVYGY